MTPAPRVALVSGQWGQNIGNAFFNLGGRYVLDQVFGPDKVGFIQDQPGYRTLHDKMKGNPDTYVDFLTWLDIDYVVLQGPVLNSWMRVIWEKTFHALRARGVKVILLSAAFFKFSDREIEAVRGFLAEYPPHLISTRDSRSFGLVKDWLPDVPKYDGIDSGFFVPHVFTPFKAVGEPILAVNFDRYPEPTLSTEPLDPKTFEVRTIQLDGAPLHLGVPHLQSKASHRSKIWAYAGDALDRRKLGDHVAGHRIVRPEHRFFPHMTHKIYRQPNSTASDEPWTYLSIYGNAAATLSDRVHACVATLAYGHSAMLFTPSPRAALFERLGLSGIKERLVELDPAHLAREQQAEIDWLRAQNL